MTEFKSSRYPNAYLTRNSGVRQGNFTPMNAQADLAIMNIYQLIFAHKERKEMMEKGNDNINFFTIIAVEIKDVLPLFEEWYFNWSESGVDYDKYDIEINVVMNNILARQKGVIQYSYRW